MATLWETNVNEIVKALSAERRVAGAVAFGVVLSLVLVVDERRADEAMAAAAEGASAHPCRLLVVIRRQPDASTARLDAEVRVGGRLGTGEAVILRTYGRLARNAESVVLPLLAPDTPVVTWWYGSPPQKTGTDPLGGLANRRITDTASAADPLRALKERAADYSEGDTDLAWSRLTPWRSVLAAAFDSIAGKPAAARVAAEAGNPSAALLGGWLKSRLGVEVESVTSGGPGITEVFLRVEPAHDVLAADAGPEEPIEIHLTRHDGRTAILARTRQPDRFLPLARRDVGDLIGEELRRLDADQIYAAALAAATGRRSSVGPPNASQVQRGGTNRRSTPGRRTPTEATAERAARSRGGTPT
ncbi:MAG: glucose-6-phosphate dehydrogenase assembly protein OpcA [Frankiaceae bacterium]